MTARTSRDVEPAAVDAVALVARQAQMHAGHRRHGAGGAEQVRACRGEPLAQPVLGLERLQHARRLRRPWPRTSSRFTKRPPKRSASVTTPTGSDVQAAMQLCASRRSDSERRRGVLAAAEVEPDQLGRAAADVEHQREIAAEVDQRRAARDRQPGLRLAADDLMSRPVSARTRCQELVRVGGEAAGLGGDQARSGAPGARSILAAQTFSASMRALDGGLRQPAARRTPSPRRMMRENASTTLEAAPRGPRDQQAAVVGAEIEGAIDGVAIASIGARLDAGGRLIVGRGVAAAVRCAYAGPKWETGSGAGAIFLGRGAGVGRVRRAAVVRVALQGLNSSAWHRDPEH